MCVSVNELLASSCKVKQAALQLKCESVVEVEGKIINIIDPTTGKKRDFAFDFCYDEDVSLP